MERTLPSPKLLVTGGAVILASGAYAIGTQAGGGTADAAAKGQATSVAAGSTGPVGSTRGRGHRGRDLDASAAALGVSTEKLRTALEDLRPDRGDRDAKRAAFAAALAQGLDVDAAKVTAALEAQKDAKRAGRGERPDRSAFFAALGKELDLGAEKVQAAIEKVRPARGERGDRADRTSALAKELGVSDEKLRAAFGAVRGSGVRGGPGHRGGPRFDTAAFAKAVGVSEAKLVDTLKALRTDRKQEQEAKRATFKKELAEKLGVSEAKVTEVLGDVGARGGPGHRGGPRHHGAPGAPFGRRP